MYRVTAPVDGFTGRVAGVDFVKGVARVSPAQATAVAYFRRHGYGVDLLDAPVGGHDGDQEVPERPSSSAVKADWVDYAVAVYGLDRDAAEAMTKQELVDYEPAGQ